MDVTLDPRSIEDYHTYLKIKRLPSYSVTGRRATFPDEYAKSLGLDSETAGFNKWEPSEFMFDYQKAVTKMACEKRKFAVFADCGLGKTLIQLEFAQAAVQSLRQKNKGFLIVAPLMVVRQTMQEAERWYPGIEIEQVKAGSIQAWLDGCGGRLGITNYEAIADLQRGRLGGLLLDESSMLKSHYGKWGTRILKLGEGLDWKHCGTGTPAPNDRIEYANHAVFLDAFRNVNAFLATYFINRGQTQERWALKDHALKPFYRALSHWSIFLTDPSVYGWKDNCGTIPPIKIHYHPVDLTDQQKQLVSSKTGQLFATDLGGIASRAGLGQIAKGHYKGQHVDTNKPSKIAELVSSWPNESTIIWCLYNEEQQQLAHLFPDAANITGTTKLDKRLELIDEFKRGDRRVLITKPKILGFGLNLQIATRQIFSGLQDSYEQFYQAVKRSNRIGSTKPLNVHIPLTDIEEPMVQNVMRKAHMIESDTLAQQQLFKEVMHV